MMNSKIVFSLWTIFFVTVFVPTHTAPQKGALVKFYPVTREQYNNVLKLTDGQPAVSEARLISNGFRSFSELRTAISQDINHSWHQLLNATGLDALYPKPNVEKVEGYPLCVIKTIDLEEDENDDGHNFSFEYKGRKTRQVVNSDDDEEEPNKRERRKSNLERGDHSAEPGDDIKDRPVINCVVVMKPKYEDDDDDNSHEHNHHHHPQHDSHEHHHNHHHQHDSHEHHHYNGGNRKRRRGHPKSQTGRRRIKNNSAYEDYVNLPKKAELSVEDSEENETKVKDDKSNDDNDMENDYYHKEGVGREAYPYNPYAGYFNPYAYFYDQFYAPRQSYGDLEYRGY